MGATHASHGLAREGQPRIVSRRMPAQGAPPRNARISGPLRSYFDLIQQAAGLACQQGREQRQ